MDHERERRNRPCPATKRNGEVCGSTIVSVSGYCFAHDPEAADWRAMGGRATAKKRRVAKRMKDAGLGHIHETMKELLDELHSGNARASDAMAMARVTDTILRMVEWAEDDLKEDSESRGPTKWTPY